MINEIKYGDIYIVNCDPSFGHEYKKRRPAIVIQADEITRQSNLVTVVLLTSKLSNKTKDDILIVKNHQNHLLNDSIIRVTQIASFDKRRFICYVGGTDMLMQKKIGNYLKKHFFLAKIHLQ